MKKILLALTGALFLLASCSTSSGDDSDDWVRPFVPDVQVTSAKSDYYVGETLELKAVASGNGTLTYQWYKVNGEEDLEIENATESVYTSQESTAGEFSYAVIVKNTLEGKSEEKRSENIKILVSVKQAAKAEKPWVNEVKSDKLTYAAGEDIKLSVRTLALDGGSLSYKWFKDDEEISGANEKEYVFEKAALGAYKFKVAVTSSLNGTTATTESENIEIIVSEEAKKDAEKPNFAGSLLSLACKVGEEVKLSVDASVSDGGTITWQWYKIGSDGTAALIAGAKNKEFTVPTDKYGEFTYKVVATNNNSSATGETKSEASLTCLVTVYDASKTNAKIPSIVIQPQGGTYSEIDEIKPLTVSASIAGIAGEADDTGSFKYAWYKAGSEKVLSSAESYLPEISDPASESYYVVVTNEYAKATGNKTASVKSDVVTVTVKAYEAPKPLITVEPKSANYMVGNDADSLSVTAQSDKGSLSYQWYMILDGAEKALEGQTGRYFAGVSTQKEETFNYFVRVTNTLEAKGKKFTAYTDSSVAKITVSKVAELVDAVKPVFAKKLEDKTYEKGSDSVAALDASATVSDSGKITYQWYILDGDKETAITNAVSAAYTPDVSTVGTKTYKVIATNTNAQATGKTTASDSMTVKITVEEKPNPDVNAQTPVITKEPAGKTYAADATSAEALTVSASVSDGGKLSYQWYSNSENSNQGGSLISGATGASYTPELTETSVFYYCIVKNTLTLGEKSDSKSKASSTAEVKKLKETNNNGNAGIGFDFN